MIYWLIYPILEAIIQFHEITYKGKRPNYLVLFLIRAVASSIFILLFVDISCFLQYLSIVLWQACTFTLIFDPLLNYLRNKDFFYKGKNSGWIDSLPYNKYYAFEIFALIGAISLYILNQHERFDICTILSR
jgi:hypothetical protein